jgi:hypothetical protein
VPDLGWGLSWLSLEGRELPSDLRLGRRRGLLRGGRRLGLWRRWFFLLIGYDFDHHSRVLLWQWIFDHRDSDNVAYSTADFVAYGDTYKTDLVAYGDAYSHSHIHCNARAYDLHDVDSVH